MTLWRNKFCEDILSYDSTEKSVDKAIDDILADLYHCGRCWSAWGYGTMGEEDFVEASHDEDIRQSVRDVLEAYAAPLRERIAQLEGALHEYETPGVRCSRLVLHVANDNQLCHREDFPSDEELTDSLEVRWSEPARECWADGKWEVAE